MRLNSETKQKQERSSEELRNSDCLKSRLFVLSSGNAGSSNGRTSPFGGEYLGSDPSPAKNKHSVFLLGLDWEGVGKREFPVEEGRRGAPLENRGFPKFPCPAKKLVSKISLSGNSARKATIGSIEARCTF